MFSNFEIQRTPYLYTSSYLLDQILVFGYSDIQRKKELLPHLIDIMPKNAQELLIKNPETNCFVLENKLMPALMHTVNATDHSSIKKPSSVLQLIFPRAPRVYFQVDQNKNKFDYSVVFFLNVDLNPEKDKKEFKKNISYGLGYVFYEFFNNNNNGFFLIPKVYCFVSKYPFFSHFQELAEHIQAFKNQSTPLEIILYHIVNHSMSPLEKGISFAWMPEAFYRDRPKITFNKLTGYPILDFNVSELFNILPLDIMLKIFIITLLEIDVIFFSKNIEMLNIFMYFFSSIHYPVTDTKYTGLVYSIPANTLTNPNSNKEFSTILGSVCATLIGINMEFKDDICIDQRDQELYFVDLDNQMLIYRKALGDEYQPTGIPQICKFIDFIIERKAPSSHRLEDNIYHLHKRLENISKKIIRNADNKNEQFIPSFFKVDKSNMQKNKTIQEAFYCFIMNIFKPLYANLIIDQNKITQPYNADSVSIIDKNELEMEKETGNESFIKDKTIEKAIKAAPQDKKPSFVFQSNEEKLFYLQLKETIRYITFGDNFLKKYEVLDIYSVSFLFFEEFLQYQYPVDMEYSIQHFEIIDSFFDLQSPNRNVSIVNFQQFERKQKSNEFYHIARMKSISSKNEFDQMLSFRYSNAVSSLPITLQQKLIPSLMQLRNQKVDTMMFSEIPQHISKELFILKNYTTESLMAYNFVIFSLLLIPFSSLNDYSESFKSVTEILKRDKRNLRKNITTLLFVYYHLAIDYRKKGKDYSHFIISFNILLNRITKNFIYPNKELYLLITLFKELGNETKILTNIMLYDETEQSTAHETVSGSMNQITLIAEPQIEPPQTNVAFSERLDYTIDLVNNTCKDKKRSLAYIYENAYQPHFETPIAFSCKKCGEKVTPKIKVTRGSLQYQAEIIPPLKIYNLCSVLLVNWLINCLGVQAFDLTMLKQVMLNLLFYQPVLKNHNLFPLVINLFSKIEY